MGKKKTRRWRVCKRNSKLSLRFTKRQDQFCSNKTWSRHNRQFKNVSTTFKLKLKGTKRPSKTWKPSRKLLKKVSEKSSKICNRPSSKWLRQQRHKQTKRKTTVEKKCNKRNANLKKKSRHRLTCHL